jgi:1,4-alpha-glucan branching enzyme
VYGGTGTFGNVGPVPATVDPYDALPASATIVIPPMGAVFLRHQSGA